MEALTNSYSKLYKTTDEKNANFYPSSMTKILSSITRVESLVSFSSLSVSIITGYGIFPPLAVCAIIFTIYNLFARIVSGGAWLRSTVFSQAEHLSRMTIQGGLPTMTLPPMIQTLRKIGLYEAAMCLQDVLNYERSCDRLGIHPHLLTQDLVASITKLPTGKMMGISLNSLELFGGHVMMGSIERKENSSFILRIHDGGDSSTFHYSAIDKNGRIVIQSTLEIDEIALENLIDFVRYTSTFHHFRKGNDFTKIYKAIPLLHGKILPPKNIDSSCWLIPQTGTSCSGYSFKCFLHFILSKDQLKKYECCFLESAVENIKESLFNGFLWERTKKHQIALRELSITLNSKKKLELPHIDDRETFCFNPLVEKIEHTFWSMIFPIDFARCQFQQLGVNVDDYWAVGTLPCFKLLHESLLQIKDKNAVKQKHARIDDFLQAYSDFLQQMNEEAYSKDERIKLDQISAELSQGNSFSSFSSTIKEFYQLTFKKEFTLDLSHPLINSLFECITNLKECSFQKARTLLETVMLKSRIFEESLSDQLAFLSFLTLDLEEAVLMEEIELRAALSYFFISSKIPPPSYLLKNLQLYQNLRLDKIFRKSIWRESLKTYFLERRQDCLDKTQLFKYSSNGVICGNRLDELINSRAAH